MIQEEGTVRSIEGDFAYVAAKPVSSCQGCGAKAVCQTLGSGEEAVIRVMNNLGAKAGDKVVVSLNPRIFLKVSAILYIVPVITLIIGGAAGEWFASSYIKNFPAELCSAISGLSAMLISFLFIRRFSNNMGTSEKYHAELVKII